MRREVAHEPVESLVRLPQEEVIEDWPVAAEPVEGVARELAICKLVYLRLFRLLPAGAKVAGWDSHPTESCAFPSRLTISTGAAARAFSYSAAHFCSRSRARSTMRAKRL